MIKVADLKGPIAYQMPGTVIPLMSSPSAQNTTKQMNMNGKLSIQINRNKQGYAEGKVFIDGGEQIQELNDQKYQYFTIQHSGKSIKKWNLNTSPNAVTQKGISSFVIVDAEDLSATDFACVWARDNSINQLQFHYDKTSKKLELYASGSTLNALEIETVYYGVLTQDINMCNLESQYYQMDIVPDLSSYYASTVLINQMDSLLNLKMEFSALQGGIINIKWNFDNATIAAKQFKVPVNDIVNPLEFNHSAKLSENV